MNKKNFLINTIFLSFTVMVALFFISCSSSLPPVNADSHGVAIKGYDAVAYHTMHKAVKGKSIYQFEWNGAKWLFSTQEHLQLFMDFPEHYSPKYGGYCTYAVSQGDIADIDPEAWTLFKGKLYLNLNKDVQALWESNKGGYVKEADKNWPGVLKQ